MSCINYYYWRAYNYMAPFQGNLLRSAPGPATELNATCPRMVPCPCVCMTACVTACVMTCVTTCVTTCACAFIVTSCWIRHGVRRQPETRLDMQTVIVIFAWSQLRFFVLHIVLSLCEIELSDDLLTSLSSITIISHNWNIWKEQLLNQTRPKDLGLLKSLFFYTQKPTIG